MEEEANVDLDVIKTTIAAQYDGLQILDLLEIDNEALLDRFEDRLRENLYKLHEIEDDEDE